MTNDQALMSREGRINSPPGFGVRSRGIGTAFPEAHAFSLLEVMIALAIFFMCIFAILGLVSRTLAQARALRPMQIDASSAIAELSLTNRLEEGPLPFEIVSNFQDLYPTYTVSGEIYEVATNGLFQIDFFVGGVNENNKVVQSQSSILLFRPLSAQRGFGGPRRR